MNERACRAHKRTAPAVVHVGNNAPYRNGRQERHGAGNYSVAQDEEYDELRNARVPAARSRPVRRVTRRSTTRSIAVAVIVENGEQRQLRVAAPIAKVQSWITYLGYTAMRTY